MTLPQQLYSADQSRDLDQRIIEQQHISGYSLMQRAASAALNLIQESWPQAFHLVIVCGTGNNGGDGFELARQAVEAQLKVTLYELASPESLSTEAAQARQSLLTTGQEILPFDGNIAPANLIVDAIFGTGLSREVSGNYAKAITAINAQTCPKLSLDIPSGISADTGTVLGCAVRANATIAFLGLNKGLVTGEALDYRGQLYFDDLHTDPIESMSVDAHRLDYKHNIIPVLPNRQTNSHKGQFGHSLIIGGNVGMSGAIRIAAEFCARTGSGLTSVATHQQHAQLINMARPELMCHGVKDDVSLALFTDKATAICIGPGLGQDAWAKALFEQLESINTPMVIDADGLNLLAQSPRHRDNQVLTPHPGEAARLLNNDTKTIQANRYDAIVQLQQNYGGVIVLKGAGTLIYDGQDMWVCPYGNPGMASGGMGDALAGIITGLIAQRYSIAEAAKIGTTIHSLVADLAVKEQGMQGLLVMDLLPHLRQLLNPSTDTQTF